MAGNRPGPKAWVPTEQDIATIKELASTGVTQADIAQHFGFSAGRWYELKKKYPEIDEAIKAAKCKTHAHAAGILYSIWTDNKHPKQFSALLFFLKTQCGWRETDKVDTEKLLPSKLHFEQVTKVDKDNNGDQ